MSTLKMDVIEGPEKPTPPADISEKCSDKSLM